MEQQPTDMRPIIVVGAGPVGLTAALLLAKAGHRVTVYEGKAELPLSDASSYPIGVNPRGQEALRRVDPRLLARLREQGEVVKGWHIYAGKRRVAKLASGTVISTTRAFLNKILAEEATATDGITIEMGHKLERVDLASRTLHFDTPDGGLSVEVGPSIVVAADGVWSATRRSMAEQLPGFEPQVGDWGVRFRVIFSQPDARAPGMDPSIHYIFGSKGMYSATLKDEIWCLAITVRDDSPQDRRWLSDEPSEANAQALREYVEEHAAPAARLFTDLDYARFFTREAFSGAVVRCPSVNVDEWLVLVGDAAHSVFPPSGEGVNAGLEDCCHLVDHLQRSDAPLAAYNAQRMPDLAALGEYAWHLMDNIRSTDPTRRRADLITRIIARIGKLLRLNNVEVEERLFGPEADGAPYHEILDPWIKQRDRIFPWVYRVLQAGRKLVTR